MPKSPDGNSLRMDQYFRVSFNGFALFVIDRTDYKPYICVEYFGGAMTKLIQVPLEVIEFFRLLNRYQVDESRLQDHFDFKQLTLEDDFLEKINNLFLGLVSISFDGDYYKVEQSFTYPKVYGEVPVEIIQLFPAYLKAIRNLRDAGYEYIPYLAIKLMLFLSEDESANKLIQAMNEDVKNITWLNKLLKISWPELDLYNTDGVNKVEIRTRIGLDYSGNKPNLQVSEFIESFRMLVLDNLGMFSAVPLQVALTDDRHVQIFRLYIDDKLGNDGTFTIGGSTFSLLYLINRNRSFVIVLSSNETRALEQNRISSLVKKIEERLRDEAVSET